MLNDNDLVWPNRRKLYLTVFIVDLLYISAGTTMAWSSPAIIILQPSVIDSALMGSAMSFGAILGPWLDFLLEDSIGKRALMILCQTMFLLSYVVLLMSLDIWVIIAGRVIGGIAVGLCLAVVPSFINEIADPWSRHFLNSFVLFFLGMGLMMEYAVGGIVKDYLTLQIASAVPAGVGIIPVFFIQETPFWLLKRDRYTRALKSLSSYRGLPRQIVQPELDSILLNLQGMEIDVGPGRRSKIYAFRNIFIIYEQKKALRCSLIGLLFQATTGFHALLAYFQELLNARLYPHISPHFLAILFCGTLMISSLSAPCFVHRFGTRNVLIFSYLGTGFSLIGITCHLAVEEQQLGHYRLVYFINILAYAAFFALGAGHLSRSIVVELAPPLARTAISSFVSIWNWLLISVTLLGLPLFDESKGKHLWIIFAIFSVLSMIASIAMFVFIPDTKGMLPQDVQVVMKRK